VAAGYTSPVQDAIQPKVGMHGRTTSMLRPAGRARFGDATLQVVTRGAYVPSGTDVEIIEVDGTRVVVETTETNA
jgi:membrane-bound serine protease (ClpP class)